MIRRAGIGMGTDGACKELFKKGGYLACDGALLASIETPGAAINIVKNDWLNN